MATPLRPFLIVVVIALAAGSSGCGTYSAMRSPNTLRRGQVEVKAGVAVSTLPEAVAVFQGAYGLTDWLELDVQHEVYNGFAELRAQTLRQRRHGVSLTLGLGGGVATTLVESLSDRSGHKGAATGSAFAGRRFGPVDLYLANRTYILFGRPYAINTSKLGVGLHLGRHVLLFVEAGVTVHDGALAVGEGAGAIGLTF